MSKNNKTQWISDELESLKEAGLYTFIRTLGSPQGAWLVVDGKEVLNFCSNNYLGLANGVAPPTSSLQGRHSAV